MPDLYLTPASISHLAQFLLTAIITVYLITRVMGHRKQVPRQDGFLLATFLGVALLTLLFFLDYSLLPAERLIAFNLENTAVALLLAALIQFAYSFSIPDNHHQTERWIAFFISGVYVLWELVLAIRIEIFLQRHGHVLFRPDYLQFVMIGEFAWVVFVFARNAVRNWKTSAVRNFALILLIPFGAAILTAYQIPNLAIPFPIVSSIGILFTIFLFALNYLSSQPKQVSFIVKISGAVLTSVLAVFGAIPWLISSAYADTYTSQVMALEQRTLHFSPNEDGGYTVEEVPFHWDDDYGEAVPYPAFNQVVGYDFDFPFLGQDYHQFYVSSMGAIGLGETFSESDFQIHFTATPMIIPLLVCKNEGAAPRHGEFVRREPGKVVITWNKEPSCYPDAVRSGTYTYQVVLLGDGSFEMTYLDLPDMRFMDVSPNAAAWAIGIKPTLAPAGTADFTRLPIQIGAQGALLNEFRSFRLYQHKFLVPIALAVIASSLFFLAGTVLVLNYGLARPLKSLLRGVQNFNNGQRDTNIPIRSNDEIGFLTHSFNQLGGELNNLIHGLEQRVAERTQELALANTQLRSEMEARAAVQEQVVEQQRAVAALGERERVARELHDGIGQVLGFINVQAQSAADSVRAGDQQAASQLLGRIVEVAQDAHDDVRGYILGLKKEIAPQPGQDFFTALEQYSQHLSRDFSFHARLNLPADIPPRLAATAVENQLLSVIREALSNARAHSGQKEAEVTITYDESHVRAIITDQGAGFSQPNQGTHFGLRIMRERAEQVGGSLEIVAVPGSGTRVTVHLPRMLESAPMSRTRILLVDDHPLFLEGMANLIASQKMQVVSTASNGLDAQEKARALHPDVILMDIEMPLCDGLEATRRIKAEFPEIKVVMLTVSGEDQHLFNALQSGASGYLLKSLDAVELTTLLEELLRGEISVSPSLANKMLEAFTRHKAPPSQPPMIRPPHAQKEPGAALPTDLLTDRQMEILRMVAQGKRYKEVAAQLGLAEVTVKYHMGEILARLHLSSRREAIQYIQYSRTK